MTRLTIINIPMDISFALCREMSHYATTSDRLFHIIVHRLSCLSNITITHRQCLRWYCLILSTICRTLIHSKSFCYPYHPIILRASRGIDVVIRVTTQILLELAIMTAICSTFIHGVSIGLRVRLSVRCSLLPLRGGGGGSGGIRIALVE